MRAMGGREVAPAGGFAGEEHLAPERACKRGAGRRAPWQRVAVAATDAFHQAPLGADQRSQVAPDIRAKQRSELLDGEVEAGGMAVLLEETSALAAEEAL